MEARLKSTEFDCYKRTFYEKLKKEESRDAVVPDTMPDIAEVLCCWGDIVIRSKDLTVGRIRVEANIPAGVLCRGEDGIMRHLEVSVPVYLSAESDEIAEGAAAIARLKLLSLEARTLNPRKILVRAEVGAEISAYEPGKFCCTQSAEGEEHIHAHVCRRGISLVSAVTEKTFALADELSLPPAAEGVKEVFCAECRCSVDETKAVGTKLIVKGKIKSRLVMLTPGGELFHLEPVTDYSQIVELGTETGAGLCSAHLMPTGIYCGISPEFEGRVSLEYHLLAQVLCRSDREIEVMDDAYSNLFELESAFSELELERFSTPTTCRESARQLFETLRPVSEIVYGFCTAGNPVFDRDKMLLPLTVTALCSGGGELWCEKRGMELAFRVPQSPGEKQLLSAEVFDFALLPVPGGMELRADAAAEVCSRGEEKLRYVSSLSYDEESPLDNSARPSLVLLRPGEGDELWRLARDNCSCVESIMAANGINDISEALGKMILIPKTN